MSSQAPPASFQELLDRFQEGLSDHGICSAEDYAQLRAAHRYYPRSNDLLELELAFVEGAASISAEYGKSGEQLHGLAMAIDRSERFVSRSQRNRALVFSERTFLLTPPVESVEWSHGHAGPQFILDEGPNLTGVVDCMFRFPPEVSRGFFVPIPKSVRVLNPKVMAERYEKNLVDETMRIAKAQSKSAALLGTLGRREEEHDYSYEELLIGSPEDEGEPESALIEAESAALLSSNLEGQLFSLSSEGRSIGTDSRLLKTGILLPSLASADPADVMRVREDYSDAFSGFQHALVRLASESRAQADESRLIDLYGEIDAEVDRLDRLFRRIERKRRSLGIVFGTMSIVFFLAIENESVRNYLLGLLGAGSHHFLVSFLDIRDTKTELCEDPFYFPLKLSEELAGIA